MNKIPTYPLTPFRMFRQETPGNGAQSPKRRLRCVKHWIPIFIGMSGVVLLMLSACSQGNGGAISAIPQEDSLFDNTSDNFGKELGLKLGQSRSDAENLIFNAIYPKNLDSERQTISTRYQDFSETSYALWADASQIADGPVKYRMIIAKFEIETNGQHTLVQFGSNHVCRNADWNERTTKQC